MEWTTEQMREFDRLTYYMSSRDQVKRIEARLDFEKWENDSGLSKETLDKMFEELNKEEKRK